METVFIAVAIPCIVIIAHAAHESRNILKRMMEEYDKQDQP